jgi:hypothetical protein
MENRDLIIPARFDSKDVVAGLKVVEESGHVAGDLGQAADAASAQFRKAHESVESALQEYAVLRRALQQAPGDEGRSTSGDPSADEAARGSAAKVPPEGWLGSGGGLLAGGARLGGSGTRLTDEQAGRLPQGSPLLLKTGGPHAQQGTGRSGPLPDSGHRGAPAETDLLPAGGSVGSSDGRAEGSSVLESSSPFGLGRSLASPGGFGPSRAITPADRPGLSRRDSPAGGSGTGDLEAFLESNETRAEVRRRQDLAKGTDNPDEEPGGLGRTGRMAREAVADYEDWLTGGRDVSRDGWAAIRTGGPTAAAGAAGAQRGDMPASRGGAETWHNGERSPEGFDPREGIRRVRAASPLAAPADDSFAEGWATRPVRERAGIPPGERGPEARFGGASTGVIERLLREQNELIRQDLQRNANRPIAAPPPLRGGGMRM